jgi:protein phosphatase
MKSVGRTHLGLVRKTNQDNFLSMNNQNEYCIFAVADGLGGHNAGEVASSYAVDELADYFASCAAPHLFGENDTVTEIYPYHQSGNFAMSAQSPSCGHGHNAYALRYGRENRIFLSCGDSRAYLIDDGIINFRKTIHWCVSDRSRQITPEEGCIIRKKHIITRALGDRRKRKD